jgi:hypothetical protein
MLGRGVGARRAGSQGESRRLHQDLPGREPSAFSMGAQADRLEVCAASKTGGGCRRLSDQAKGPLGSCSMAFCPAAQGVPGSIHEISVMTGRRIQPTTRFRRWIATPESSEPEGSPSGPPGRTPQTQAPTAPQWMALRESRYAQGSAWNVRSTQYERSGPPG